MIELYTDSTPNGFKISIALEELGLEYEAHNVDFSVQQLLALLNILIAVLKLANLNQLSLKVSH